MIGCQMLLNPFLLLVPVGTLWTAIPMNVVIVFPLLLLPAHDGGGEGSQGVGKKSSRVMPLPNRQKDRDVWGGRNLTWYLKMKNPERQTGFPKNTATTVRIVN